MKTAREQYAWLLRSSALGLVTALLIARPLIPGEDAAQGSGLLFVLLWLLAAVLWALSAALGRNEVYRPTLVDAAVALLVASQVASAVWVAAARRPAINMAWEWIGLGLVYALVRQLAAAAKPARMLLTVVAALALSLSLHGLYQRYAAFDDLRADYERNPARMLDSLGIVPGDWAHEQFRRRLYSNEPYGTFALANSLAGFLVPWVIVTLGAFMLRPAHQEEAEAKQQPSTRTPSRESQARSQKRPALVRFRWWFGLAALGPLVVCLALTHSRSAYLGVLAGGFILAIFPRNSSPNGSRSSRFRIWMALTGVVLGLMILSIGVARYVEQPVIRDAFESIEYRVEYWQSAWEMIKDSPRLGVGPGNFRQHYVRYKLPQASEEVLDPHNLILDVWATGGTPAMVGLCLALGLFAVQMLKGRQREAKQTESAAPVFLGAIAGWLIGFVAGVPSERLAGLSLGWALGVGLIGPLMRRRAIERVWLLAGVAALVVHLAGQGGIAIPPVAQNLWLLLAVAMGIARGEGKANVRLGPLPAWSAAVVFTAALALCFTTAYGPVTQSRLEMVVARDQLQGNFTSAVEHARQAAKIDPLSTEPWLMLLRVYRLRWEAGGEQESESWFEKAVEAARQITRLDPYWAQGYKNLGDLYLEHARKTGSPTSAARAVRAYQRCCELYPTSARRMADLSDALWESGEKQSASARAKKALLMEQKTKHAEKFLHPDVRERLQERIGAAARSVSPGSTG